MGRERNISIAKAIADGRFVIPHGGTVKINGVEYRADGSPVPSDEDKAKHKRRAKSKTARAARRRNRP